MPWISHTIDEVLSLLIENGVLIFDGPTTGFTSDNPNHLSVPLETIATEAGKSKIMVNSVATGAVLALLGYDLQPLLDQQEEEFAAKGQEIVENHKSTLRPGLVKPLRSYV